MAVENNGNKQVNNNDRKEDLERDRIHKLKRVTTSHPSVSRILIILRHLNTDKIRLLLPQHIIHDKVPPLSSGNPYQRKERLHESLKVGPLINCALPPQHGEHLHP